MPFWRLNFKPKTTPFYVGIKAKYFLKNSFFHHSLQKDKRGFSLFSAAGPHRPWYPAIGCHVGRRSPFVGAAACGSGKARSQPFSARSKVQVGAD
ncbi:hypothetical protein V6Z11_A12G206800 [Gossypium hirsutum]